MVVLVHRVVYWGSETWEVEEEQWGRLQLRRMQSNSWVQSDRHGALAQKHEAGRTGLPQHCTRGTVTGNYHADHWADSPITVDRDSFTSLPLSCPGGHTLPLVPETCLCTVSLLETFTLNMNSLNNKWKLSEITAWAQKCDPVFVTQTKHPLISSLLFLTFRFLSFLFAVK